MGHGHSGLGVTRRQIPFRRDQGPAGGAERRRRDLDEHLSDGGVGPAHADVLGHVGEPAAQRELA